MPEKDSELLASAVSRFASPEDCAGYLWVAFILECGSAMTIDGEQSLGEALGQQTKLVATNVTVVVLKDTGHWVLEERLKETTDALQKFL